MRPLEPVFTRNVLRLRNLKDEIEDTPEYARPAFIRVLIAWRITPTTRHWFTRYLTRT